MIRHMDSIISPKYATKSSRFHDDRRYYVQNEKPTPPIKNSTPEQLNRAVDGRMRNYQAKSGLRKLQELGLL